MNELYHPRQLVIPPLLLISFVLSIIRIQAQVRCRAKRLRDKNGNDETVDCDDTGHDDGNKRLWYRIGQLVLHRKRR